jgi:hypothetical protein
MQVQYTDSIESRTYRALRFGRVRRMDDTGAMKVYLATGLVCFGIGAVIPGAWLLRQPNGFEVAQLVGVGLVIFAGYLTLWNRRSAAAVALAGYAAIASFMIHATFGAPRVRGVVAGLAAVALAVCLAGAVFALRSLGAAQIAEEGVGERRGWSRVWALGWPTVLVLVVMAYFWPWRGRRDPNRYLVPDGYVGWVVIEYGVAGAAPLQMRHGALEYAIPLSGRLQTSSKEEFGMALDDWESVNTAGVRTRTEGPDTPGGRLWRWSTGVLAEPGKRDRQTEQFFVGTEAQFKELADKTYPVGR